MKALTAISFTILFATSAFSQAQMARGDIKGTVSDSIGAVLPSVAVGITNMATGLARETTTGGLGNYTFLLLRPGEYELVFELNGFGTEIRRPVRLLIGQSLSINSTLMPAAVQQEVIVTAEVPVVELQRTQQADTITERSIDDLPINQRDFLDFTLLAPGVTDSKSLVTFTLPLTPNSGLSFAGQSGRNNSVTIDGLDNNDAGVAAVRSTISQDAVQEFQINRSNYGAEFGRASGGVINIVSKSGANDVQGSVFAFLRNQSLDARNAFAFGPNGSATDPPFKRVQSGFTLGGPLARNRSFYFLSYEGRYQRESNFSTFLEDEDIFQVTELQESLISALTAAPVPSFQFLGAALRGALTTSEAVYPGTIQLLRDNSGVFPFRNNDNTVSLRVDHQVSSQNQVFARASYSDTDTVGGSFGGLKGPSRGADFQVRDFSFSFGDSHFFGPNVVNEFRFQYANRQFNTFSADAFGPEININGTALVGRDFFLPAVRNEQRFQLVDNFNYVSGSHQLKFGGEFQHIRQKGSVEIFFGGRFSFAEAIPLASIVDGAGGPGTAVETEAGLIGLDQLGLIPDGLVEERVVDGVVERVVDGVVERVVELVVERFVPALSAPITSLQSYNLGLPTVYQQGFGDPVISILTPVMAGYVQDKYQITENLTLNIGLRYDMEFQPSSIHRDTNNIAPRFGFAYSPDGRTVIRGGYGFFYAPVFQAVPFIESVLDGTQVSQLLVPLTDVFAPFGITTTSAEVWGFLNQQGIIGNRPITAADIAPLGLSPGTTPPVLFGSSPELVNPYSQHASFGIERELGTHWSASVDYLLNRGVKLLRSRNVNAQIVGISEFGPEFGPRFGPIDPRKLQDNHVESSGSSIYHGMTATLKKRFSDFHQLQVSYTLSKAIDDYTDFITDLQPANQLDLAAERSLSAFDQRHRLVVSGMLLTPFERGFGIGQALADITVAPIITVSSGRPFNLLLGFDANGDTNANTDRPPLAGRNTGKGPRFTSVDLRVSKSFEIGDRYRIDALVEGFNLFNTVNFSGVNNVVPALKMPPYHVEGNRSLKPTEPLGFTSAHAPRQIQLGIKFAF